MISKIFITGKSFGQCCRYVCEDLKRSQVLEAEGVRKHDLGLMTDDFELQQSFANQVKEKPVLHAVLSHPHGECPGDETLVQIGRRWLQEIRMANTQHIIVKHTDKEHLHLHILANRVSNDGTIVGEGLVIERGIEAARKLTQEYGLRQDQGKNLHQTNRQALHEPDAKRYRLYELIKETLPGCQRMEDLEQRLLERGVSMRYRIDQESGRRQGISFRLENHSFKGSEVDRAYSLKGLEQILALQQKQAEEMRQAQKMKQALEPVEDERRVLAERLTQAERQRQEQAERQHLRQGLRLRQ
jgi:Relaxase/Mobilisation nuclease domain